MLGNVNSWILISFSQVFLNQLELSGPNYDLKVRSISNINSPGKILAREDKVLMEIKDKLDKAH